jgi:hypothetical protein
VEKSSAALAKDVPFQYRPVPRRIEISTVLTPEPPSLAVPQIPEGTQPAFHEVVVYETEATGNVTANVGAVVS